jgi:hypothetical protein
MVDMDTLALKNETVIAVGNMNVNARGDKIGKGGNIIKTREELMSDHYRVKNSLVPEERPMNQRQEVTEDAPKIIDDDPTGPLDEPAIADTQISEEEANDGSESESDSDVEEPESTGEDSGGNQSQESIGSDDHTSETIETAQAQDSVDGTPSQDEWVEDPKTGDFVRASELDKKKSEPVKPNTRGLAGALAEAKSVDEIPKFKTAKEKARSTKGVKRL